MHNHCDPVFQAVVSELFSVASGLLSASLARWSVGCLTPSRNAKASPVMCAG